jgi:hypothetical protein
MSAKTRVVERLTMTGPNTLTHELTYDDPETFTAPWTTRIEWIRDDGYQFYEYACHEGNHAIRGYISSSRAKRRGLAAGTIQPDASDDRSRFVEIFDRDPGVRLRRRRRQLRRRAEVATRSNAPFSLDGGRIA